MPGSAGGQRVASDEAIHWAMMVPPLIGNVQGIILVNIVIRQGMKDILVNL